MSMIIQEGLPQELSKGKREDVGKFQRKGKKIAADVKAQGGDVKAQCGEQLRCVRFSDQVIPIIQARGWSDPAS